jgi:hypothetical protein
MGMFDQLRCHVPLPVEAVQDHVFQTKSLDCTLANYEITPEGRLLEERFDYEDHSSPDQSILQRLQSSMVAVNRRWEAVDFTGEVEFYTSLRREKGESESWIEFVARFEQGALKGQIELVTCAPVQGFMAEQLSKEEARQVKANVRRMHESFPHLKKRKQK